MSYDIMVLPSMEGSENLKTSLVITGFCGPNKDGKDPRCIQVYVKSEGDIEPAIVQLDMPSIKALAMMLDDMYNGRDVENWGQDLSQEQKEARVMDIPEKVRILNQDCYLQFGVYKNETLAITAYNADNGEPHVVCTINWEQNWKGAGKYSVRFKFPMVVIKNCDENKGVFQDLIHAKVIDSYGPYMQDTHGGIQVSKLSDKWARIANRQLETAKRKGT